MGKNEKKVRQPAASASETREVAVVKAAAMELATQLCDSIGLELVHIEYHREPQGLVLRVYIDKVGGVMLDDCATVSRELSDLLDVHLDTDINYNLEVSSPGIDRPLGRQKDYERFRGETVRIKTRRPVNDRKKFTGILMGISEGIVQLNVDGQTVAIPYDEIGTGRLVNYNGDNRC
jgi:ribosome maturation factor RimP